MATENTNTNTNETTPPTQLKKDTVELRKTTLDALMKRLETLEKEQKQLLEVQDRRTKSKIEELRRAGKLVKNVKLRSVENKSVIGWKTIEDDVYFSDGRLIEKQTVEVWLDDGEKKHLSMRQWATIPTYSEYEVIKESKDSDGNIILTVRRGDGKELDVNVIYVN
jgi:hypothetical protein